MMSIDRIKYRRMLQVYLADTKESEESDPEVWKFMQDGNFSLQKNQILFTALGRDYMLISRKTKAGCFKGGLEASLALILQELLHKK